MHFLSWWPSNSIGINCSNNSWKWQDVETLLQTCKAHLNSFFSFFNWLRQLRDLIAWKRLSVNSITWLECCNKGNQICITLPLYPGTRIVQAAFCFCFWILFVFNLAEGMLENTTCNFINKATHLLGTINVKFSLRGRGWSHISSQVAF